MFSLRKWFIGKYIASRPMFLSSRSIEILINKKRVCPDCGEWKFHESIDSGLTSHIRCFNCGSRFNDDSSYNRIERLFMKENTDWRKQDKYQFSSYKNYKSYTWTILKKWHKIEMSYDTYNHDHILNALEWCGNETSKSSLWSIKDTTVYFKNKEDAMAFKLKWI